MLFCYSLQILTGAAAFSRQATMAVCMSCRDVGQLERKLKVSGTSKENHCLDVFFYRLTPATEVSAGSSILQKKWCRNVKMKKKI